MRVADGTEYRFDVEQVVNEEDSTEDKTVYDLVVTNGDGQSVDYENYQPFYQMVLSQAVLSTDAATYDAENLVLEITFEYFDGSDRTLSPIAWPRAKISATPLCSTAGTTALCAAAMWTPCWRSCPCVPRPVRGLKPKALDKGASVCFNEKSRGIGKAGPPGTHGKEKDSRGLSEGAAGILLFRRRTETIPERGKHG